MVCTLAGLGFTPFFENIAPCMLISDFLVLHFAGEDLAIFASSLHELDEVVIMFFECLKNAGVIMYGNNTWQIVGYLVHPHLEHSSLN